MPATNEAGAFSDLTLANPDYVSETEFSYGFSQLDSYIGANINAGEDFVADVAGGIASAVFIPMASLGPVDTFNIYLKVTSTVSPKTWTLSVQPFFRAKRIEFVEPATQVGDKMIGATLITEKYTDVATRTTGSTAAHDTIFQFGAHFGGGLPDVLVGGLGSAVLDTAKANYMLVSPYVVVNLVNASGSGTTFRIDDMAIWGSTRKKA